MSHLAYSTDLLSPSVQSDRHAPELSSRYSMVRSDEIVDALHTEGWYFTGGTERHTRNPERRPFVAHVLKFTHNDLPKVNGNRIEAVVLNSHDGATAFRLALGIFRIACANGHVVCDASVGQVRLTHVGLTMPRVLEATHKLVAQAPKVAEVIDRWSGIQLHRADALGLARRCALARWDRLHNVDVDTMLNVRRTEDGSTDLWTVYNRIQESVLRGGMKVGLYQEGLTPAPETVRFRRATAVRGAFRQVELNEKMWQIGEEFAQGLISRN